MERPIMNPGFLDGDSSPLPRPTIPGRVWALLRMVFRFFFADISFWHRRAKLKVEDVPITTRIIRGLVYRALFVPVLVILLVGALVFVGTHPVRVAPNVDPVSQGIYYDPVNFLSSDGTRLEGWLVPMIDAKYVLNHKEQGLRDKQPAIILLHDFGSNQAQMLPLVEPFHDAGYVVLVITLRGSNAGAVGSTFGLRESQDVLAAVDMLRRRREVDAARIAVLGVGTGANAAMLAIRQDSRIAAAVLDRPLMNVDAVIAHHLAAPQHWLRWLRPFCKWTFELAYQVDAEDLNLAGQAEAKPHAPVLVIGSDGTASSIFQNRGITQAEDFLARCLQNASANPGGPPAPTASTGSP